MVVGWQLVRCAGTGKKQNWRAGLKQGTWIKLPEKQLSLGTVFWGRAYKELVACPFRQLSFSLSAPPLIHSKYLLFAS